MKRSQPETSGGPPAKKHVSTKIIPAENIGAVANEVSWHKKRNRYVHWFVKTKYTFSIS